MEWSFQTSAAQRPAPSLELSFMVERMGSSTRLHIPHRMKALALDSERRDESPRRKGQKVRWGSAI